MTTARQQYIIGVDLGGTNIVCGAMSLDVEAAREAIHRDVAGPLG